MSQFTHELSTDEIEARVDVRGRRKAAMQQRDPRPDMFVLFDELVLLRGIGGPGHSPSSSPRPRSSSARDG